MPLREAGFIGGALHPTNPNAHIFSGLQLEDHL